MVQTHATRRTFGTLSRITRTLAMVAFGASQGDAEERINKEATAAKEVAERTQTYRERGIIGKHWSYGRNSKNHGPRSGGSMARRRARRFARAHGRRIGG